MLERSATRRVWLVACILAVWPGCTCRDSGDAIATGGGEARERERRIVWLDACVADPRQTLVDLRSLIGTSYGGRTLPNDPDLLAAHFSGLSTEQLNGSIDWDGPARVLLFEPRSDRPLTDGLTLRFRRPASQRTATSPMGRRSLDVEEGSVYLEADREHLWASRSPLALDAALALGSTSACADDVDSDRGGLRAHLARELLTSRQIRSWVTGHGAWLETTARQGTARHGRSDLGDPEAAARALAGWGERTRERLVENAPLTLTASLTPESLQIDVDGSGEGRDAPRASGVGRLDLIAPDAYLVLAGRSTPESRRERATDLLDVVSRIAGDRLSATDRSALEEQASALAATTNGWVTFALRPAHEPGPLVAVAALECSDTATAAEALEQFARHLTGPGYFRNAFEHLGVRLESAPTDDEPSATDGGLAWLARTAEDAETRRRPPGDTESEVDDEPRGLLRLTGTSPALAWRRREGVLLVAFGPDPRRELNRMCEALDGDAPASALAQPLLQRVTNGGERVDAEWLAYGWAPAVAALLTQGGPGATGLPPGGFVVMRRRNDQGAQRTSVQMDRAQVRSVIRLVAGGGRRSR